MYLKEFLAKYKTQYPPAAVEYIMNNSLIIPFLTIRELASVAQVSTTTILRFVKKMGYDSYNDFKYAYSYGNANVVALTGILLITLGLTLTIILNVLGG